MLLLRTLNYSTDVFDPSVVFGTENREKCVSLLRQFKAPIKRTKHARDAAVLVPLCVVNGEASILYTVRSQTLTSHRGQVSFPGGMFDESDIDLSHTAVREAEEELGLPPTTVDIWTVCNSFNARNNVIVAPVVANIGEVVLEELVINPKEVSSVFVLSLRHLCNPAFFRYTQFRNNFIMPAFVGNEHRVWGLTASITHFVMRCLLSKVYDNHLKLIKPVSRSVS